MMLESIKKLMTKDEKGSRLHLQNPEVTARLGHWSAHTYGLRPGAAAESRAPLPDAIKLRPTQPISSSLQCFPPPVGSGRGGRRCSGGGALLEAVLG